MELNVEKKLCKRSSSRDREKVNEEVIIKPQTYSKDKVNLDYPENQSGSKCSQNKQKLLAKIQKLYRKPNKILNSEVYDDSNRYNSNKIYLQYSDKMNTMKSKQTINKHTEIDLKTEDLADSISRNASSNANFGYYKTPKDDKDLSTSNTNISKYKKRMKANVWNKTNVNLTHVLNHIMVPTIPNTSNQNSTERPAYTTEPSKLMRRSSSKKQTITTQSNSSLTSRNQSNKKSLKLLKHYDRVMTDRQIEPVKINFETAKILQPAQKIRNSSQRFEQSKEGIQNKEKDETHKRNLANTPNSKKQLSQLANLNPNLYKIKIVKKNICRNETAYKSYKFG